jgi:hypothetical protein
MLLARARPSGTGGDVRRSALRVFDGSGRDSRRRETRKVENGWGGEVEGGHARLPSSQRVERSRSRSRGGAERERGVWRRDEMRICRCQLLTPEKFPGSHGAQRGCPMKSIAATWPRTYNPLPLPPPPAPAPAPVQSRIVSARRGGGINQETPRRPLADLAR